MTVQQIVPTRNLFARTFKRRFSRNFSYGFRLDATKGFVSSVSFLLKQVSSRSNAFELPSSGTRSVVPSPRTSKILAARSFELKSQVFKCDGHTLRFSQGMSIH